MQSRNILEGDFSLPYWAAGIKHFYPPGYPFLIALFSIVIRDLETAALFVNVIAGLLLMVSIYIVARDMYDRESAVYSAALTAPFPILISMSSNVYSEATFILFYMLSLLASYRLLERKSIRWAFLSGLAMGAAYLMRTQALVGMISLALVIGSGWLILRKLTFFKMTACGLIALAGFSVLVLPYGIYLERSTGSFSLGGKIKGHIFQKRYSWSETEWYAWERRLNQDSTQLEWMEMGDELGPAGLIASDPHTYLSWVKKDFADMMENILLDNDFIPLVIIIPVLVNLAGRRKEEKQKARNWLLLCWFIPLPVIAPFTAVIIDRYFVPIIPPLVLLAAGGTKILREEICAWTNMKGFRRVKASHVFVGLSIVAFFSFPSRRTESLLFEKNKRLPEARREVAKWASQFLPPNKRVVIMASKPYTSLYSGNDWFLLPIEEWRRNLVYARDQGAEYILVDSYTLYWLDVPERIIKEYMSPASKPGLEFLGIYESQEKEDPKKDNPNQYTLYRVLPEDTVIDKEFSLEKPVPQMSSYPSNPDANVILISIDTLRADHLGCYGYSRDTSPAIDKLAREGVLFKKVISQYPKTLASHMTMFTSLYPSVHKSRTDYNVNAFNVLSRGWVTLGEVMKKNGYSTAAFTGGGQVNAECGLGRGFDYWEESLGDLTWPKLQKALDWVEHHNSEKIFLFLHTYQVHDPYIPPSPYNTMYDPEYDGWIIGDYQKLLMQAGNDWKSIHNLFWGGEENGVSLDKLNISLFSPRDVYHMVALYDGGVRYTDDLMIGKFLEEVKEFLPENDTLVILTSDHGEEFMEHGYFLHRVLYRETLEVPLIMKLPGILPCEKVIGGQVRLVDLMPTILDILDIDVPQQTQGQSLAPFIFKDSRWHVFLTSYSEVQWDFNMEAIQTQDWKYIKNNHDNKTELYYLPMDAQEQMDNAYEYSGIKDKMEKLGDQIRDKNLKWSENNTVEGEIDKVPINRKRLQQLRNLGYIE